LEKGTINGLSLKRRSIDSRVRCWYRGRLSEWTTASDAKRGTHAGGFREEQPDYESVWKSTDAEDDVVLYARKGT
jgi:hypothetical protein